MAEVHVVTLPPVCHRFALDLFERAVRNGLIGPEELHVAANTWERLIHVQVVDTQPTTPPPSEEAPHEQP